MYGMLWYVSYVMVKHKFHITSVISFYYSHFICKLILKTIVLIPSFWLPSFPLYNLNGNIIRSNYTWMCTKDKHLLECQFAFRVSRNIIGNVMVHINLCHLYSLYWWWIGVWNVFTMLKTQLNHNYHVLF